MIRWEYKVLHLIHITGKMIGCETLERELNVLGDEGWEIAFILSDRAVLKRVKLNNTKT